MLKCWDAIQAFLPFKRRRITTPCWWGTQVWQHEAAHARPHAAAGVSACLLCRRRERARAARDSPQLPGWCCGPAVGNTGPCLWLQGALARQLPGAQGHLPPWSWRSGACVRAWVTSEAATGSCWRRTRPHATSLVLCINSHLLMLCSLPRCVGGRPPTQTPNRPRRRTTPAGGSSCGMRRQCWSSCAATSRGSCPPTSPTRSACSAATSRGTWCCTRTAACTWTQT
jgi:hypothetical protein